MTAADPLSLPTLRARVAKLAPTWRSFFRSVTALDFETHGIDDRPAYPPAPVGLAVFDLTRGGRYLAFGHPDRNNATRETVENVYRDAVARRAIVYHNAAFDVEVGAAAFGARPPLERIIDTLVLAYLATPEAPTLSLKPYAQRRLGVAPDERDALREWIVRHVPEARRKPKSWGRYIARAPGDLVGRYAIGDAARTFALAVDLVAELWGDARLRAAYARELEVAVDLVPEMERDGIGVDVPRLEVDVAAWDRSILATDRWLARRLHAPELNVDADDDLADALERAGLVTEWVATRTGGRSVSIPNLRETALLEARPVVDVLAYRSRLVTYTRTFGRTWLERATASTSGDRVHVRWNPIRQPDESGRGGTRTGRASSNPNVQNVPRVFENPDDALPPKAIARLADVVSLPTLRDYVVPTRRARQRRLGAREFLVRDYSQQELRLLAHFEGGALAAAYRANPRLDHHEHARQLVNARLGTSFARKPVKNMGFGIIYGMGLPLLAERIGYPIETARTLRAAYKAIFPGLKELDAELAKRAAAREPIWTWGGRRYFCEPPVAWQGRVLTFEYKMLNTLIQGSAADMLKEAMLRYRRDPTRVGRLVLQVHDELVVEVDASARRPEMTRLRAAMDSIQLDVPVTSDGKAGPTWARLEEME